MASERQSTTVRKEEIIMRIAVLTGGGDCPGLNGAIKWVTKTALDPLLDMKRAATFDVIGIKDGWKGLVEVEPDNPESLARHTLKLDEEIVRTSDTLRGNRSRHVADEPLQSEERHIGQGDGKYRQARY